MPGNIINDWSLELGFDAQKVEKGLNRVEKRFDKLQKKMARGLGGTALQNTRQLSRGAVRRRLAQPNILGEERGTRTTIKGADTSSLAKANALVRKRLQLQREINKAQKVGVPTQAATRAGSATKNTNILEQERLKLSKKILAAEQRVTAERRAQARVKARGPRGKVSGAGPVRKDLSFNQRLAMENKIARVQSEATFAATSLDTSKDDKALAIKKALRREVSKLNTAQKNLANTTQINSAKYQNLQRRISKSTQKVRELKMSMRGLKKSGGIIDGVASSFKRLGVASLGAFAVLQAGRAIFETTKQLDSLKSSMLAASGSAAQAKLDFAFVTEEADKLGTNLFVSAKGFQMLGSSMRGKFSPEVIRESFIGIQEAIVGFGLSAENAQGVFKAFSQIASKGTVQAEELRGQLGDRLPGAFQRAAEAMGVTTDQLNKMLKRGEVASDVFLPKMIKRLSEFVTESGAVSAGMINITAAQNRMTTSWTKFVDQVSDAGSKDIIKDIFSVVTSFIKILTPVAKAIVRIVSPIVTFVRQAVDLFEMLLVPIFEVIDKFVSGVVFIAKWVAEAVGLLDVFNGNNNALDETIDKVNILVKAFQVLAGIVEGLKAGLIALGIFSENIVDAISDETGIGEGSKVRTILKGGKRSGEEVGEAFAAIVEANDRIKNFLDPIIPDFLVTPTRRDQTGRIFGSTTINVEAPNIQITESNNPDLTQKAVQAGMQEGLKGAMPNDQ